MQSRTRAVLFYVAVIPFVVVFAGHWVSTTTPLRFDVLVFTLTVASVLGWLAMVVSRDGPVVTENTDSFGQSRSGDWHVGDPRANRDSFDTRYRVCTSLVAAALLGWVVVLVL